MIWPSDLVTHTQYMYIQHYLCRHKAQVGIALHNHSQLSIQLWLKHDGYNYGHHVNNYNVDLYLCTSTVVPLS